MLLLMKNLTWEAASIKSLPKSTILLKDFVSEEKGKKLTQKKFKINYIIDKNLKIRLENKK